MSDQWLYRIRGQQFGPVSLELVRTLVASGAIAPDDEVRDTARSNWILACAATELRVSTNAEMSQPAVERRIGRDEWYCRGYAGDYGPLSISELIQLAADGELQPDEEIKSRVDDYWRQIRSIRRLVDLLPFPNQPRLKGRSQSSSINSDPMNSEPADILPFPGIQVPRRAPDEQIEELISQLKNFIGDDEVPSAACSLSRRVEPMTVRIAAEPCELPDSAGSNLVTNSAQSSASVQRTRISAITRLRSLVQRLARRFLSRNPS